VAKSNIQRAGLSDRVDIRVGGRHSSPCQKSKRKASLPFDFIFIDADKPNNPGYLEWAIKLSRTDTIIIVDNVVRDGEVADASSTDPTSSAPAKCLN
jgi:predicted O-methyltransferase YrrM